MDPHGVVNSRIGFSPRTFEDHAPLAIGNPVAMIVEPFEGLWAQAEKTQGRQLPWFANLTSKSVPDGRSLVNARIGRNLLHDRGGVNPMGVMLADG